MACATARPLSIYRNDVTLTWFLRESDQENVPLAMLKTLRRHQETEGIVPFELFPGLARECSNQDLALAEEFPEVKPITLWRGLLTWMAEEPSRAKQLRSAKGIPVTPALRAHLEPLFQNAQMAGGVPAAERLKEAYQMRLEVVTEPHVGTAVPVCRVLLRLLTARGDALIGTGFSYSGKPAPTPAPRTAR